jgi:hypothetical protein
LADGRIPREAPDSEPLTDLLTVFFGAGIFTANSAFQFGQWQTHSHQGWQATRLGYLSEEQGKRIKTPAGGEGRRGPSRH